MRDQTRNTGIARASQSVRKRVDARPRDVERYTEIAQTHDHALIG
jgi:hypothetical protein